MNTRLISVVMEPVFGCNKSCAFCGLQRLQKREVKFMPLHVAHKIGDELCAFTAKSIKVGLGMTGEPTLHPDLVRLLDRVGSIRTKQQTLMITNGIQFIKNPRLVLDILDRIDYIIVDLYHDSPCQEIVDAIMSNTSRGVNVVDYYAQWVGKVSVFANHKRKIRNTVILMDDVSVRTGEVRSRTIHNFGGNAPGMVANPIGSCKKVCVQPLKEIAIRWDGTIPICCLDMGNMFPMGHVGDGLQAVWESKVAESARRMLRRGFRSFSPCCYCTTAFPSQYTIGSTGKYPEPTEDDQWRCRRHAMTASPINGMLPWESYYS